jgi:hypothetical protein
MLLSGCDSERLKEFSSLAAAGSAYTDAFPAFSNQLESAVIKINNDQAVRAHALASDPETAKKFLLQQDADLKAYLRTLHRINAQVQILGAYFNAMADLASAKPSEQIVTSANGLVDQLEGINSAVGKSKLRSLPDAKAIDELAGPVINVVVTHLQVNALDQNLQKNAEVVDRALALQEAAIKAMTLQLSLALQGDDPLREQNQVVAPYLLKELPNGWAADRTVYLRSSMSSDSVDAAQKAITKLRAAFQDVVADKASQADITGLLEQIGEMSEYANKAKETSTPAN